MRRSARLNCPYPRRRQHLRARRRPRQHKQFEPTIAWRHSLVQRLKDFAARLARCRVHGLFRANDAPSISPYEARRALWIQFRVVAKEILVIERKSSTRGGIERNAWPLEHMVVQQAQARAAA